MMVWVSILLFLFPEAVRAAFATHHDFYLDKTPAKFASIESTELVARFANF